MSAVCNSSFHSTACYAFPFMDRLFHGSGGESLFTAVRGFHPRPFSVGFVVDKVALT